MENITHVGLYDGFTSISSVDLKKMKKFYDKDAFTTFEALIARKREASSFKCGTCELLLAGEDSILCDCCLLWHHLNIDCANSEKARGGLWFCQKCKEA